MGWVGEIRGGEGERQEGGDGIWEGVDRRLGEEERTGGSLDRNDGSRTELKIQVYGE